MKKHIIYCNKYLGADKSFVLGFRFYSNNTYDEKEVNFFDNLNDKWWGGKEYENKCNVKNVHNILNKILGKNIYSLHDYNKHRFDFILKNYEFLFYEKIKKEKPQIDINILDVGCGGGILCEYIQNNIFYFLLKNINNPKLKKINVNIEGIDVSSKLIELSKRRLYERKEKNNICYNLKNEMNIKKNDQTDVSTETNQESEQNIYIINKTIVNINLKYKNCDISDLVYSNNLEKKKYDIITSSEVLEHIPNNKKDHFINCISKICNPMSLVVFTTINKNTISYLYSIVLAEYITKMIPKGTHNYDYFIEENELNNMCKQFELYNLNTEYVIYIPIIRNYFKTNKLKLLYMTSFVYKNNEE
ncbi:3-demethylubiquinone-9 3-methyltransferase, putative [Plasmodium berghei]|uniref:Ubiquinone biosynthesis O-methyltransferase, putative n=3 Tax=Plasmodium berghei TaxID=5821 RepID=A0A509AG31_PLABA|nr:ubiquinone biosynthesis O-methyltransferase, putative [Plasmodium berghei ANKA]CXI20639.1 3-demethylubiquinone-9 3-methyltransferase, putative [Plasmodium berghei]SCO60017.1 3-demethylubiquinone-9 3-methyltransferase, putative [Plasmodium berghei]VUC54893.1 ubiquinone biosynthesis O-methyltransferase, putative [Plasmodium berghei ANKA]|eukprot:XP_034420718.1 ubiquinone biosynthesis O-methyltransferase, putative [Plasmodium berghei ANKA]